MTKQKIAIYLPVFLNFSETFIYQLVKNISKYEVWVICKERRNEDKFPYPRVLTINSTKELAARLRIEQIELVHAQFGLYGAEIVDITTRAKIPLITHFRGQDAYQLSKKFFIRLSYRNLFKKGNLFLTVSEQMKKHLMGLGCPEDKIQVYYGGIDLTQFPFAERKFTDKKEYKILMCGRFVEKKGYDLGLRALFAPIRPSGAPSPAAWGRQEYNVTVNLIGEGPEEAKLKKLAQDLGILDRVNFLGKISYDQIKEQMRQADILLAPYRTAKNGDSEGIPNILKEAMAVGLPVITTNHSGNPELAIAGKTALVANENNLKSLIATIQAGLNNYGQFAQLTENGRKLVEQKFDLAKQITAVENLYAKILK